MLSQALIFVLRMGVISNSALLKASLTAILDESFAHALSRCLKPGAILIEF